MANKSSNGGNNNVEEEFATAPYNFVKLNDKVIHYDKNKSGHNSYCSENSGNKLYTGYITLKIKSKTPLYVRGLLSIDEHSRSKKEKEIHSAFFGSKGSLRIPGSSIRGMVKNMVSIVSWGKFNQFDDKLLFQRGMADKCLGPHYGKTIPNERDTQNQRRNPPLPMGGYLEKKDNSYYIIPAKIEANMQYRKEPIRNPKVNPGEHRVKSGRMPRKENMWVMHPKDEEKRFLLDKESINLYRNDANRNDDWDLLKQLKNGDSVPCFYVHRDKLVLFGHTRSFRIPYSNKISCHIPIYDPNDKISDFCESLFGTTEFASRVFFEDAKLEGDPNNALMKEAVPEILSAPKPTSFQNYLEQPKEARSTQWQLKHWDDDALIRGHKLYWHRNTKESGNHKWKSDTVPEDVRKELREKKKTLYTIIQPVKTGSIFSGKIRFENLTAEELGALLFALALPENCCHKIGMGKPLGLGSAEINVDLMLINRKERYSKLFSNGNWELAEENASSSINQLKKVFSDHMLKELGETKSDDLWGLERMRQLKILLGNHNNIENWLEKTIYMDVRLSKWRHVLPTPEEVINKQRN